MPKSNEEINKLIQGLDAEAKTARLDAAEDRKRLNAKIKTLQAKSESGVSLDERLANQAMMKEASAELAMVNRQTADVLRVIELEKRNLVRDAGSAYKPDFQGIVEGQFQRLDAEGNYIVGYRSKNYKTIGTGDTSIKKGQVVQLFFASNSYYSNW